MAVKKWSDVRDRHIESVGADVVAAHSSDMLASSETGDADEGPPSVAE